MKPMLTLIVTALLTTLPLLSSLNASAQDAGGNGSHGGDALVIEFTGTAKNLYDKMRSLGNLDACPVDLNLFKDAIDPTKTDYSSKIHVYLPIPPYSEVYADNKPGSAASPTVKPAIALSRTLIANLSDPLSYLTLVLHEHFGLLGIEGTNDTGRSQACLTQIRGLMNNDKDFIGLIYRLHAITTFEEQFAKGLAALECKTPTATKRVLFRRDGNILGIILARRASDGTFVSERGNALNYRNSSDILSNFKSEYVVSSSEINFKFDAHDYCAYYHFESNDHVSWTINYTHIKDCELLPDEVRNETTSLGTCTPVYFRELPLIRHANL